MPISELEAGQSENVDITVTVTPSLSVSLSGSALALGTVAVASTTESGTAIVVENNSSGVAERFSLAHSTSGDWTSGTTPGAETFALNVAFAETIGGASWTQVDLVVSGSVDHNGTANLWFQFKAPTTTSATAEQTINVTVNAQLP